MVFLASKDSSALVQGSPPGELRLRIVGSARDGQLLTLSAAKCSIGSAEGCTLRLRARGVRPVHCLLLRGARGTVARAWAPNTRLNGEPFRDALLSTGDRLSIGPVEFEIVSAEGPPEDPFDAGRTVVLDRRPAAHSPANDSPTNGLLSQTLIAPSRSSHKRWRSHVRRLVAEVRKLREEIDCVQREVPDAAQQADELRQRADAIRQQNAQWEATLASLQSELDARGQSLEDERDQIAAARNELDLERQRWQEESAAAHQNLTLRETEDQSVRDTLAESQLDWQRRVAQFEAELAAARGQIDERERELRQLASAHGELEDRQLELAEVAARLDQRARQLDERQAEIEAARLAGERVSEELAACRIAFQNEQADGLRRLGEQRGELDERRSEFETQRAEHEAYRLAAEQDLRGEAERIGSLREALEHRDDVSGQFAAELSAAGTLLAGWLSAEQTKYAALSAELESRAAESAPNDASGVLDQLAELAVREAAVQRSIDELAATRASFEAEHADALAELESRTAELAQRQANAEQSDAQDTSGILDQLAELAAREAAVQRSIDELAVTRASFAAEHADALTELENRRTELAGLESTQQQQISEHHRAAVELLAQIDTLTRRQHELDAWQSRLEAQREELTVAAQPAVDRTAQPAADRTELDAALAQLAADREELEAERDDFARIRQRSSQRLEDEARELAEQRDQLDAEREAWLHRLRTEQPRLRTPAPQYAQEDEEDDDAADESQAFSEFSPQQGSEPRPALPDRAQQDTVRQSLDDTVRQRQLSDDDSMESYIAAFMDRMRAGQPAPVAKPEPPSRRKRKSDPRPVEDEPVASGEPAARATSETPVQDVPVLDVPDAPRELERRKSTLEEDPRNMSVLREIGLSHARSAIDTHGQQRSLKQAYGTLGTSAACFVAAFIVLWFSRSVVMHTAGIVILVVAIYWMASSIWAAQKLMSVMKRRRHNAGGLRATLAEVEAELESLRMEAEEAAS